MITNLKRRRITAAKRAFTTRRVPVSAMQTLISRDARPKAGDLVLATVDEIGKHQRIELPSGRRARMVPGDEIIVSYGNRYAPDQFEAIVGEDLSGCDLVAAGGIAAHEIARHDRMIQPTRIIPVGLIGDSHGQPLNLTDFRVPAANRSALVPTVLVAGTAMNAGKTFTAASLVRGFTAAGLKVAGIKATGTGAGGDLWHMLDMGAHMVLDFTDAGFASTYLADPDAIEAGIFDLMAHAAHKKCDVAVVEIADGLQHEETAAVLRSERLRQHILGVVFAAYDALGARAGVEELRSIDHNVLALSGQLTRSPLAMREATRSIGCACHSPIALQEGILNHILQPAEVDEQTSDQIDEHDEMAAELMPNLAARRLLRRPELNVLHNYDAAHAFVSSK